MTPRALIPAVVVLLTLVPAPPARAAWAWPVAGEVITTYRNGDDPYAAGQHRGIDIAGQVGTPVVAAAGGEVRFAGVAGSSGLTVSIRTADGRYDTSYLHLSSASVRKGELIATGMRVGAVGTSGVRSVERAHLHLGVRDAGSRHAYHDPLAFLPPPGAQPDRPRPAPAPNPAPVPLAPEPAPAPRAAPSPALRPAPAPRLIPRPAPRPAPRAAPAPRHTPAPHHAPAPRAAPRPAPALRGAPVPIAHGSPAPSRLPARGPRHAPGGAPAPWTAAAPRHDPRPHRPNASEPAGPDLGWVLACLGLLAAAALLGLSEGGRETTRGATRTARRRISAFVNPLLGGR